MENLGWDTSSGVLWDERTVWVAWQVLFGNGAVRLHSHARHGQGIIGFLGITSDRLL